MRGTISFKGLLLTISILFYGQSYAQTDTQQASETPLQTKKNIQTDSLATPKLSEVSNILTPGFKAEVVLDKKDMLDFLKIGAEIDARASLEELMNPAADLYGENSWGEHVNPFAGQPMVSIPATYEINCRDFVYPLDEMTRVNSHYGYRRRFRRMHYGIDLHLNVGDSVRSCFDGKVRLVNRQRGGYGKYIVVRHPNGLETVYGHLSKQIVKEGDIVRAGDVIGLGGNTGRSTGPHLHLEMRFMGIAINPSQIINFQTGIPNEEVYVFDKKKYKQAVPRKTIARKRKGNAKVDNTFVSGIPVVKVRKGDTLGSIAQRYETTISKLCVLNGISPKTTLRVGQPLRVKE